MGYFRDPLVVGGLVTSHKSALYSGAREEFDLLEPVTGLLSEIGVVFKRGGELCGGVSDIKSGGLALDRVISASAWPNGDRVAVVLGAGGAGLAAVWNLAIRRIGDPQRVVLVEEDDERRAQARQLLGSWPSGVPVHLVAPDNSVSETIRAGKGPLIVNATGMGKDRPGSPYPDDFEFPLGSTYWDFNYRGEQQLLKVAIAQSGIRRLSVFDGFDYFASGWSAVMTRVAGVEWTPELFREFRSIAESIR